MSMIRKCDFCGKEITNGTSMKATFWPWIRCASFDICVDCYHFLLDVKHNREAIDAYISYLKEMEDAEKVKEAK